MKSIKKLKFIARLKAWGQVAGTLLSWFLIMAILSVVPFVIDKDLVESDVVGQAVMFAATILTAFIWSRYIYRERFKRIGISSFCSSGWRELLWGIFYGGVSVAVGFLICYLCGIIGVNGIGYPSDFLIYFGVMVMVGISEELLCRGYVMRRFAKVYGNVWAIVISSAIFMAMHMFNDSLTIIAFLNLFLAGVLFGVAYMVTKSLWLPIGMHFAWNFVQGPVLGYSVSGSVIGSVVRQTPATGPDWISGGAFGFEGSLLCSAIVLILILILYVFHRKKSSYTTSEIVSQ